jgi:two-component system, response regulator
MCEQLILLFEDEPKDDLLTLKALKQHNICNTVVVAHDGVEALDYLLGADGSREGRGRPLPQLILLDLKLPKIDGFEVLRRIRTAERTRLLPVVILTSSAEETDILDGYRLGTNSYICKPVDFVKFADAVRQMAIYWLLLNKPPQR